MSETARIVAARDLSESERQAKREIMPLLEYDRVQLMLTQPFLGSLAMRLELVPVVDCRLPTAATDGEHLFFNAEFMRDLDTAKRQFIMAHEVWHCAALHIPRRGKRERLGWNLAIDHETNHVLGEQGLEIPQGAVHYPEHAGDNAETVYAALQANPQLLRSRGSLADQHDPGGDQELPASGPIDPDFLPLQGTEIWEQWPRRVTIAAQQLRYLYGHQPGWLKQLLSLVGEPAIAWQELLRRFIERSHTSEYRWTRPNRRFLTQGLILPGRHSEHLSIAVGIDVSGSTLDDLPRFLAELKGILTSFSRWTLRLVACDTRIIFDQVFSDDNPPPDDLPIGAGGGTDLQPVIDVLADQPPSALVFLTDGYASEPSQPDFPVLWAISDQGQQPAPWGELISLPPPS
jgi:predicted metal-dependent peptidase